MGSVVHELSNEEIKSRLEQHQSELRELRFTFALSRALPKPHRVNELKKNVARYLTVLAARESGKVTVKPKTERKKKK
jgi:ribosomal protein L29